ncbi:uncharacterized protein LOC117186737 [Drosophila miranda]|uniref:uncharacterized protein LOC117186737 n=1 Tax=Drosophila miranda TaxID=7229 RepID=UPI00143F976C|nr:uncharacterized protein LOC117186737 [Drosophila miranda]
MTPNQTMGYSFKTQDLCTLRFAINRVVSDFPLPKVVLFKHYRGWFETDRVQSQPDRIVSQQGRSAPLARSEPNKPSSSFDLAIDNKDFPYGNQGRGYAGY